MRRHFPFLAGLATAAAATLTVGFTAGASAATRHDAGSGPGEPLPHQVFAPYFKTYDTSGGMAALSKASRSKFLSLAFLQAAVPGSCTAYWDGDPSMPIGPASFGADIAAVQARGGIVIPSFGGYTADTTGTEIADSCSSSHAIAQVFESLITTYRVPRIDLDIEADSLSNAAAINRRNEAIAETEQWAAAHYRRIQFSYTLPTFPTGLTAAGLAVLQNAVADGASIPAVHSLLARAGTLTGGHDELSPHAYMADRPARDCDNRRRRNWYSAGDHVTRRHPPRQCPSYALARW